MARYSRSRSYGRRRYGYRRRFRRYFSRFRTRYRTIFRTRYRNMRRRGYSGGSRRYSFTQWIWKLGIVALLIFGGVYVWNNYLKGKIIKV